MSVKREYWPHRTREKYLREIGRVDKHIVSISLIKTGLNSDAALGEDQRLSFLCVTTFYCNQNIFSLALAEGFGCVCVCPFVCISVIM